MKLRTVKLRGQCCQMVANCCMTDVKQKSSNSCKTKAISNKTINSKCVVCNFHILNLQCCRLYLQNECNIVATATAIGNISSAYGANKIPIKSSKNLFQQLIAEPYVASRRIKGDITTHLPEFVELLRKILCCWIMILQFQLKNDDGGEGCFIVSNLLELGRKIE